MSHTINTLNTEDYMVTLWEREKKNQILKLSDSNKKQALWNKLFPKVQTDDSWMLTAKVF